MQTWLSQLAASGARALKRLGSEPAPVRRALVLSGGGARSSFQIGALARIYEDETLAFDTIAGTSAGSILGGVIAQHADPAGQRAAVAELERLWTEMSGPADMFRERPWFSLLQHQAPVWQKILRSDASSRTPHTIEIPAFNWPWKREEASEPTTVRLPQLPQALTTMSDLWAVAGPGSGFDSIARGALTSSSIFTPGDLVDRIVETFEPARVAASGVRLRVAVVALESGELRYVDERGELRDRADQPLGERVDLVAAIAASCAIPAVFAPVKLGAEHYVDGGVRMNLPADIVAQHLGADECIAISSAPQGVQTAESYAESNIVSTVVRSSATLMSEELSRQEVARARAAGMTIIEPLMEVHDSMTVEPGLIRISRDYGYVRAAQVLAGASREEEQLAQHLFEIRRLLWALQAEAAEEAPRIGEAAAQIVQAAKRSAQRESLGADPEALAGMVRDLTLALPGATLPPGSSTWGRRPEFD
ncbi:Patatin-like phospholipase [Bowdeniella nasicola]|uniref:Patatin-like phospholipase n=1 Tax=Bowdeniella nasicola TaxID=208480 RepID=A0A1H3Y280_9ACTO|nr:patatin-like phospholipase family protein [Bowdeniella nasicola]SEA04932.1 Patatin-like phospholipase [Bowdeniella nasicola]